MSNYFLIFGITSCIIIWLVGVTLGGTDFAEVFTLPLGLIIMFIILGTTLWDMKGREGL